MKVNLYKSAVQLDGIKEMFKNIDNSDFSIEHIVVVPDRFSLLCEKLLLEILPSKALFNVKVKTITSLSLELMQMMGIESGDVLSSGEALLLTQKAIDNVKDQLLTFKKRRIAFTYEASKLISQLKSCSVLPEELNDNLPGMTGAKYHDLKLIYSEQQRLFGDKIDVNMRLKLLNEKFVHVDQLDKSIFYFAGFNAFTKEGYEFIKNLILYSCEVNFALLSSLDGGNDYIYDKDIEENIMKIASQNGISINVFDQKGELDDYKDAIARGVYSYEKVRKENDGFYNLYSATNISEEVETVAKLIRYHVFYGERYKNIQIAISDLQKYSSLIENIFDKYDIPYYIDESVTAENTMLGRLVLKFLDGAAFGFYGERLINLLSDILLGDNSELIAQCLRLNIDSERKYKKYIEPQLNFSDIIKEFSRCKKTKDYNRVILALLEKIHDNFDKIMENLEKNGDLKEKNINVQMFDIFNEVTELLDRFDEEIDASEYQTKLKLLLSFKEVSTVPTYADGVMIGDATDSFFDECNILFVMGGQALPRTAMDNGLLSDEEMSKNLKEIEPTIRMINRRNRFKVFSLLTCARNHLFITYQQLSDEGKKNEIPSFIASLNNIFGQIELRAGNIFFNRAPTTLDMALLSAEKHYDFGDKSFDDRDNTNVEIKDMCFENGVRVTQLEQYYSCPFKQFANYGLKLKEQQTVEFDQRDSGNICHKGDELFIKHLIKNKFDFNVDIDDFIEKNIKQILSEENDKLEMLDEKQLYVRYIKRQLKSNFSDILREIKNSKFRPKYLEKSFDDFYIDVDDEKFKIIGRADRIDFYNDDFRIIDYKTGKTGNILKELYYGEKLQLFLYQKIFEEQSQKHSAGAFYFNAKLKFAQDDEDKLILKGLVKNDREVLQALDTSLTDEGKSGILPLKLSQGEYGGNVISKYNLSSLSGYSLKLAQEAIKDICGGFIKPLPSKEGCNYCKFASLCGYEKTQGCRKQKDKIDFEG